ncbi:MAG TPA: ABC transporter permease [Acetobacteraceae bacterium]|nr:ABC transporter permease [Acetobacteraceae bacterium]
MSQNSAVEAGLAVVTRAEPAAVPGYWAGVQRRLWRDKTTMLCGTILLAMALAIAFAGAIAPHDPYHGSILHRLKPIGTPHFPLGTDELGRDMLTRLLYGGRLSWFLGITPVAVATVIGASLGVTAGFAGGMLNTAIMRMTDVFYAFPSVLLAVAISGALGAGVFNAILSLTIVFIPPVIRVAESVTTGVRNLDYVESARASGAGTGRIVYVQVLPNVLGPIFVYSTSLVGVSMIVAAGLSFLGLGTTPPLAEWGLMLNTLRPAIYLQPMVTVLPGFCIFLTSFCFNMVSDGLRAAMDVRR